MTQTPQTAQLDLEKKIRDEVARRRTFAIISHPDAGKTTLTEKLLLYGGAIHLAGSVKARRAARHATSDWMEIEKQRGISVTTAVMQFVYDDWVVNILDTPGHQDFSEDTYRTLAAADAAVMLIDVAKGVEPQTEKLFRVCQLRGIPVFTFVNKMDRHGKDPLELMTEIESHLGMRTCPINWPIFDGADFVGVYERDTQLVHVFEKDASHGAEAIEAKTAKLGTPEADEVLTERAKVRLKEDLELLDIAGDNFDPDRVRGGTLSPMFFGSAMTNFGVKPFLEAFLRMAPQPGAVEVAGGNEIEATDSQLSGFVFKIQANMDAAHRDRIAFFRVTSGRFVKGMDAWHPRLEKSVRLKNPTSFMARERSQIDEAFAGDIVGLFDPGMFRIGDALTSGKKVQFLGIPSFSPELFRKVRVADPLKRKKMIDGLNQLAEEGAVQVFTDWHLEHPDIVGAVGTLQFDVLAHRLEGEYGCAPILTTLPYTLCRWVVAKDSKAVFDSRTFKLGQGSLLAHDRDNHVVVLFSNNWGVNWCKEQNKDFDLLPVSPLAEHAGNLSNKKR